MKTVTTIIEIFTIIAAMGIGSIVVGLTQAAHASPDCSIGQAFSQESGPQLGRAAPQAAQDGGLGELFAGYNQQCHFQ